MLRFHRHLEIEPTRVLEGSFHDHDGSAAQADLSGVPDRRPRLAGEEG
jgi:anti-sigma factor ChrR (cupin superfamily)